MAPAPTRATGRWTVLSLSAEQTRQLGERCGRSLTRPLVLALIGGLGSGKTVFVQGLARGLDVPAGYYVTSPSFTLINEYPGRLPLVHIDLYRLDADADLEELGMSEVLGAETATAVEWGDKLPAGAVDERLEIRFDIGEDDCRTIHLEAYGQAALSLVEALAL
jgi:tRNA threonylcarbamoyladenosine biosynthesis protein TsaE